MEEIEKVKKEGARIKEKQDMKKYVFLSIVWHNRDRDFLNIKWLRHIKQSRAEGNMKIQ